MELEKPQSADEPHWWARYVRMDVPNRRKDGKSSATSHRAQQQWAKTGQHHRVCSPQCGGAGKKEAQRQPLQLEGRNRHIHFVSTTESGLTFFSSQQSNPTLPAARHSWPPVRTYLSQRQAMKPCDSSFSPLCICSVSPGRSFQRPGQHSNQAPSVTATQTSTSTHSLVTEHRKKKFHRSLSRDLSKTSPYQIDRGRFFSPSLIWEALTFKVQPSSQRNGVPEEERDSNTWNT